MTSADKELEDQLMQAGNRLVQPQSSVEDLLTLLDQVENFLSRVEQSPPKSMQTALSPSMKALVADELLRHSDADVKVAVASCISEITRITAPDAPYDDDQMKDVFQLIVSSFESLSDKSSRSYNKRTSILETVAKVRSCVVMLDLECDGLIVEMFQHFLKAIRDYHPANVFSSMETIMTLVVEESEDISIELLSPILASVKKGNEEVQPIARKLGERVFESCAVKLKPYLTQAVKSLGLSLDDYSQVIATLCEGSNGAAEHTNDNDFGEQLADESKLAKASSEDVAQADESKLATASSDAATQVAKESVTGEASAEEANPAIDKSPKSVMSNGTAEINEDTPIDPESLKKPELDPRANESDNTNETSKVEPDDLDAAKSVETEPKPDQTVKRRGKKQNSVTSSAEPPNSSQVDSEKETKRLPDRRKSRSKEIPTSPSKDPSSEAVVPSEHEKETGVQLSSPKVLEGEAVNVASPPPSGTLPDEGRSKKGGRAKKKENLIQEASPSADIISKKVSEGTSDSEVKPQKRSEKKKPLGIGSKDKTPALKDISKNDDGTASDSEEKPLKQSVKKRDVSSNFEDESSLKDKEDGKRRRGRGKVNLEKDVTKSAAKDDNKENLSSPKSATKVAKGEAHVDGTPKTDSKRKRTPGKESASDTDELGENLVNSKVKVWWPKDRKFYEGVIASYDSVKKRHKVVYTDGDEEVLNLQKERWETVRGGLESVSDGEHITEHASPDNSSDMPKKKKAKTSSELSAKQRMEVSPKRSGGASSSKMKSSATKSGRKSEDDNKVDSKSKDITSSSKMKSSATKSGRKSEDDSKVDSKSKDITPKSSGKSKDNTGGGKSKDKSLRSGKSIDDAPKTATKSKEVDGDTPKTSNKSKQDTPKTVIKSKGKKSNAKSSGKGISSSLKVKETEDVKEKSPDRGKTPESAKGKSPGTSKARESEGKKSGKKRRRGVRS